MSYQIDGPEGQICVSPKSFVKFKQPTREILNRNHGKSTRARLQELTAYLRGWIGYFALEQRKSLFAELDKWLRAAACALASETNGSYLAPASRSSNSLAFATTQPPVRWLDDLDSSACYVAGPSLFR